MFSSFEILCFIGCHLSKAAAISLANALISSKLDYCNSLYRGLSKGNLKKLQYVQNTMARIVTRTSKWSHITPALKSLHWLPVKQRVIFKTVTLIYKYLHSGLPKYFGKYIIPYESSANTCLADKSKKYLEAPFFNRRVHKSKTNFDCCFSTDSTTLWNGLPEDVRLSHIIQK